MEGSIKSKQYIDFRHKTKEIISFWCKSHLKDVSSKHIETNAFTAFNDPIYDARV